MTDYLIKSVTQDGNFRAYAILTTDLVAKAQVLHDTWASSSAALGRTLTGGLLMAASVLKGDDKLSIKFDGQGPVGNVVVEATPKGKVKGYIQNPHVNLAPKADGHIDVAKAVGQDGFLTITKDQGFGMPFTGQVPIVSGEIGEDFTYYLAKSEQIPSAVGVSVFVNADSSIAAAGGFLIQLLPGADDEAISALEKKLAEMPMLSELLLAGKQPEEILTMLFDNTEVNVIDKIPVEFECDCSKEKFATRMAALPKADLQDLMENDHGAEVVCPYCNTHYQFTENDLQDIIDNQA
ncbi:Hsp33 family molecular chaperone HslO [Periweissella ghanensis]|uniref:33 kDa chaperonin n=1 Tax=Periweissella ghanensis TaxID=467997 RepID=A0ABM8ZBN7_9LACO|nr:Hsp33 family molecular chaperone HslO [Periweissella ghanensis]MCM0600487.1 Hsp33 family molecular chaperone HslO [Periweissella ghanensis]CAH0418303.1 33 kDa chaperonin [Periweissella ghanensis]